MAKVAALVDHVEPLYNSVPVVAGGVNPPKHNAAVCVPDPAVCDLATLKFPVSVQAVPLYSSVFAVSAGVYPPKVIPAVVYL